MHPFPDADSLRFLVGLEVGQVCLDPWTIQLRFSECARITVEGKFHHTDANGDFHIHNAGEQRDTGPIYLRELVSERIADLSVTPSQLTLSFTNGAVLSVLTDEGPYERGQIYPPGQSDCPIVF